MISLSPDHLNTLYPFSLITNSVGEISFKARSIQKLFPKIMIGDNIFSAFKLQSIGLEDNSTNSNPTIEKFLDDLFLCEGVTNKLPMRGKILKVDNKNYLWMLYPKINRISDIRKFGLSFEDFTKDDPILDFVMLSQAQTQIISSLEQTKLEISKIARFPDENPNPILRYNFHGQAIYKNASARDLFTKITDPEKELIEAFAIYSWLQKSKEAQDLHVSDKHYQMHAVPFHDHGYINIYLLDITDTVRVQAELEQERIRSISKEKMAALGEMAGGIAHEINNPLAIIDGKAQVGLKVLSRMDITDPNIVKIHDSFEKIMSTTHRISKIIHGLRLFSRNGDKQYLEITDLKSVINQTLDFCFERFRNHGVELTIDAPESLAINCRSVQISQVILNLLNNAYDAIQEFPTKWIRVEAKETQNWVEIAVIDCGHGIPGEIAEKMLQPFFTTKDIGKGTGLGLSISKGIIEDHHGQLVYDATSINTKFVILLPKVIKTSQAA